MSAIVFVVTNVGRAALVNATNTGTAPVTIAACGITATAITPSATTTTLPGEIKRIATLSGSVVAADTIHLIVRDATTDTYNVKSMALYLADGTLFASYGQTDVIIGKAPAALMLLAVDIKFVDVSATSLTFGDANFLNPPATTDAQGVVELATDAETVAATDASRAVTPHGLGAKLVSYPGKAETATISARWTFALAPLVGAYQVWHPGNDGAGSGLDADTVDGLETGLSGANRLLRTDGSGYLLLDNWLRVTASTGIYTGSGNINFQSANGLKLSDLSGTLKGYLYFDSSGFGLVNETGGWAIRANSGGAFGGSLSGNWTMGGSQIWTAANDGSGSGLDADLVRGYAGNTLVGQFGQSYYQVNTWLQGNVRNNGMYWPANAGGGGMTHFFPSIGDVWTYGSAIISGQTNGYAGLNFTDFGWQLMGNSSARGLYRPSSGWDFLCNGTDLLVRGSYAAWHSGNDGSGSGLDADLLDGADSSYFMNRAAGVWQNSLDGLYRFHFASGGATYISGNGAINFSTDNASTYGASLDGAGNFRANDFGSISDIRLKSEIEELDGEDCANALAQIGAQRFTKAGRRQLGGMAQAFEKHFPEVVGEDEEGWKHVYYGAVTAPIIAALNHTRAQLKEAIARIDSLEGARA